MEKELVLLGATAIEDKLQEGVPEAIAQLQVGPAPPPPPRGPRPRGAGPPRGREARLAFRLLTAASVRSNPPTR